MNNRKLIYAVTERAAEWCRANDLKIAGIEILTDLIEADMCEPLHWVAMASAPISDLMHDVLGIRRHLDRETTTPRLLDCFSPRLTRRNLRGYVAPQTINESADQLRRHGFAQYQGNTRRPLGWVRIVRNRVAFNHDDRARFAVHEGAEGYGLPKIRAELWHAVY